MTKWFSIILLSVAIGPVGNVFGQAKSRPPDFSGTWTFDRTRSRVDALVAEMLRTAKSHELKISIQQEWPAITITVSSKVDTSDLKEPFPTEAISTETFYADGRGEHDPINTQVSTHQAVAKMVDNKLVILFFGLDDYNKKILYATFQYSLSDNGNTLIREAKLVALNKAHSQEKVPPVFDSYMVFSRTKQ